MTVETTSTSFSLSGDGSTTTFPFSDIRLFDSGDLEVYIIDDAGDATLQVEGVDYSLTINTDSTSGNVVFDTAPASDETVFGIRNRAIEQPFDIPLDSDFDAEKIESIGDNSIMIIQDQQATINRSVKFADTYTGSSELTDPASASVTAGAAVVLNDDKDGLTYSTVNVLELSSSLETAVDSAETSASNAATSESNASTSESNAATSESNASTSESNAAASESNAADSESNASMFASEAEQSAIDAEVAKIEWQGEWDIATAYEVSDAVEYDGGSYIAILASTGEQPDTSPTYWDVLAQKGSTPAELNDISDVDTTGVTDEQVLTYESSSNTWKPANVGGAISGTFESSQQTLTPAGLLTLAHGLGVEPVGVELVLYCAVAQGGYSVGDRVLVAKNNVNGGNMRAPSVTINSTNVVVRYASGAPLWQLTNKSTGGQLDITSSSWRLIVKAWG